jgi:polygalacturonase
MSWEDDVNIYNDPIVFLNRKGDSKSPYKVIKETVEVINGRAVLREVPERLYKVNVTGNSSSWFEVENEELTIMCFQVDYVQGVVFFDAANNGLSLTFEYTGKGAYYAPDSRIYLTKPDGFIQTANEKFDDLDREDLEQKNRVDTLITENPQPSEVVDLRIDRNGTIFPVARDRVNAEQKKIEDAYEDLNNHKYPTLKDRIDGEQFKIEEAYSDLNGKAFGSLKDRIDAEQGKIEDAYVDKNGLKYSSLKQRIDAEQFKIEEAYTGADGKTYTSLKNRFDTIDDTTSSLNRRLANSVADMKTKKYKTGEFVFTLGYYTLNDSGHGTYSINSSALSTNDIILDNGLFAHLMISGTINVRQFGAKGDNTNDDAPAIQAAFNEVKNIGGATVYIPKGQFLLKSELVIYENTTVICDQGAFLIRNHIGYMILNGDRNLAAPSAYGGNGDILIQGGTWDAKGVTQEGLASIFHFGHGHDIKIFGATFKDCRESHHIEFNACRDVIVRDCKFLGYYSPDTFGVEAIQLDIAYPTIDGKVLVTILPADSTPCKNVLIENNYFGASGTTGALNISIAIGGHNAIIGKKLDNIKILNNTIENTTNMAIRTYHWDNVVISGNKIVDCGAGIQVRPARIDDPKDTITPNGTQTNASEFNQNIIVDNNIIIRGCNYSYPIIIWGEPTGHINKASIKGNIILSDSTVNKDWAAIYAYYVEDVEIVANRCNGLGAYGIIIEGASENVVVSSNNIDDSRLYGVRIAGGSKKINVIGNVIRKTGQSGIILDEASSLITVANNIIDGVNGNPQTGDDSLSNTHIKAINGCKSISITGNIATNLTGYTATNALYVTDTCSNISRAGNNFAGLVVTVNATGISNGADLV